MEECSGDIELILKVDGELISELKHTIKVMPPPKPKIKKISYEKSTDIATIQVICYGLGNELQKKILKKGSWQEGSKNSKPSIDKNGNRTYTFKIKTAKSNVANKGVIKFKVKDSMGNEVEEEFKYKKK